MKKYLPRPSSSSIGLVLTYAILLLGRIFNLWNFNIRDRERDKGDWELPQVIGTVVFTANNLKFFSSHDFSLTATRAGHWLLGRPKQLKREKS